MSAGRDASLNGTLDDAAASAAASGASLASLADASCQAYAPGQSWYFPFVMLLELVRILIFFMAGTLLAGGAAYGGVEELFSLEQVRTFFFLGDSLLWLLANTCFHV